VKKYLFLGLFYGFPMLSATEHLEPEESRFTRMPFLENYYQTVISALEVTYKPDIKVKAIVLPSFRPEYAVGIKKNNGIYHVFHKQPSLSYWGYTSLELMKQENIKVIKDGKSQRDLKGIQRIESRYPKNFRDIKINTCERTLEETLAIKIIAAWEIMLLQTSYTLESTGGLDGTTYHFSNNRMAGQTWSPSARTKPGKLVAITDSLIKYCLGTVESTKFVQAKLEKLSKALKIED
jgi:hypothetical protein